MAPSARQSAWSSVAALETCERAWKRRGIQGVFEAGDAWRPGTDARSRATFALKYGWWAFQSGERSTAFHYGMRALKATPFNPEPWRLLVCSLIKTPRKGAAAS